MNHEQNASRHPSYGVDPDLIAGAVIVVSAGLLMLRTTDMPTMTALLPIMMLSALILLGVLLIGRCLLRRQRQQNGGFTPLSVFTDARRFLGIIISIGLYIAGITQLGFYSSTAIMVPVVAWCFGYRSLKGVLLADLIFTGSLAVIFVLLMGQDLPAEFFLR